MTTGVSTLAFAGFQREEIVKIAEDNNWLIEFSSSFPYQKDMVHFFENIDIKRIAHNYFPAPASPFVLNLASTDNDIRERSLHHCLQGLRLSQKCGAPYFSAHAGFCIDPRPGQLGQKLDVNVPIDRSKNWELFIKSIRRILLEAAKMEVSFLVENNVTSKQNIRLDGQEVLFCSTPSEMQKLIEEINDPRFGLLLDTAHLKVSAHSLEFEMHDAVNQIGKSVRYLHHSDNNAENDTNSSLTLDYWFLPHMKEFRNCIHILEVKNIDIEQVNYQLRLLQKYGEN